MSITGMTHLVTHTHLVSVTSSEGDRLMMEALVDASHGGRRTVLQFVKMLSVIASPQHTRHTSQRHCLTPDTPCNVIALHPTYLAMSSRYTRHTSPRHCVTPDTPRDVTALHPTHLTTSLSHTRHTLQRHCVTYGCSDRPRELHSARQPSGTRQSAGRRRTVPTVRGHRAPGDVNTSRERLHDVCGPSGRRRRSDQ